MYILSSLVKETIPNYLAGLPIPDSFGGWFRLGGKHQWDHAYIIFYEVLFKLYDKSIITFFKCLALITKSIKWSRSRPYTAIVR